MYDLDKRIFAMHGAVFFDENLSIQVLRMASKIQEDFITVFPSDPQILPLPDDAPKEIPRCVFKNDRNATISLAVNRLDFDGGFKEETDWKNNISIVMYNFLRICNNFSIKVDRIGMVVRAEDDGKILDQLESKVDISEFKTSDEKNITYIHKYELNNVNINVVTTIEMNKNIGDKNKVVSIDINTAKDFIFPSDLKEQSAIVQSIIDEIGGKLENVF